MCDFEFPHGKHPCVVIGSAEVIGHRNEVVLDQEDGLDWTTLCRCDFLFTVPKERVGAKRGSVCAPRRREIVSRVLKCLAFAGV